MKKVQRAGPERYVGAYGCRYDVDTGLTYMRQRWYDAGLQRFVSRDPIPHYNQYAYADDTPTTYVDPTGLDVVVIYSSAWGLYPYGHIAIAIEGYGVFSFGTHTPLGSSLAKYIQGRLPNNSQELIYIKTTQQQDAAMMDYINHLHDDLAYQYADTCAARVADILAAGGLVRQGGNPYPSRVALQAEMLQKQLGGSRVFLSISDLPIPSNLDLTRFEPQSWWQHIMQQSQPLGQQVMQRLGRPLQR